MGTTRLDLTAPGCTCGHVDGRRRLISKASIYGWGLNFQHCNHVVYFPTHSYEQYYQSVRRSWRFGQAHPVTVDVIASRGVAGVMANLQRKSAQADRMFDALLSHMTDALHIERHTNHDKKMELPTWVA